MKKDKLVKLCLVIVLQLIAHYVEDDEEKDSVLLDVASQIDIFVMNGAKKHSLLRIYNLEGEALRTHIHFNYQEAEDGHFVREFD